MEIGIESKKGAILGEIRQKSMAWDRITQSAC